MARSTPQLESLLLPEEHDPVDPDGVLSLLNEQFMNLTHNTVSNVFLSLDSLFLISFAFCSVCRHSRDLYMERIPQNQ